MNTRVYTVLFPFCGVGGGALGFQAAVAAFRGLGVEARFEVLGGIDYDASTARDFERLTGTRGLCADVSQLTPEALRDSFGERCPDVVFFSPPCKASSGLLSGKKAETPEYQAMAQLALVWLRLMFAAWPEGPSLVLMENVPRITTRHAEVMREARSILRRHGYATHDEAHDLGAVGGLGQHRKRLLMVGRATKRVPALLYQPTPKRVRSIGEVIGALPLPGDPAGGPLHRLPKIDAITAVRLALIPAGKDWRALPEAVMLPPDLHAAVTAPRKGRGRAKGRVPFNDVFRVVSFEGSAPCITTGATPSAGGVSIADPRITENAYPRTYGVMGLDDTSATITGNTQTPGGGPFSVADPRVTTERYHNNWRGESALSPGHTVTGVTDIQAGAPCVADPRLPSSAVTGKGRPTCGAFTVADPRPAKAFAQAWGVLSVCATSGTVIGTGLPSNGAFAVADPRLTCNPRENSGAYGVMSLDLPSYTVTASACHDNGWWSVADRRTAVEAPFPVVIAADGTWHRPLTALECAALQSLVVVKEGKLVTITGRPFALEGGSRAVRVKIGDAVPALAAQRIAEQVLLTLTNASMGTFSLSSGGGVWVRERDRSAQHGRVLQ